MNFGILNASELNFNADWEFVKDIDTTFRPGLIQKETKNIRWETVSLPHTANIEPLVTKQKQWQGICFYRKFFTLPVEYKGKHVVIQFGAAMNDADIYINGEYFAKHLGGYLPFSIDVSDKIYFGKENSILVKLSNEDNPVIPPGKPLKDLDFNYYSGLYRDVKLLISDKLYITNAVAENKVASGGIMVWFENVTNDSATIFVKTEIKNDNPIADTFLLNSKIVAKNGKLIAFEKTDTIIGSNSSISIIQKTKIHHPNLWSPSNPYLYNLTTSIYSKEKETDTASLKIGIRTFSIDASNGLLLNGNKVKLRGTNRHQEYPYIGYALSNNAQYRDAYKIKLAGFNFVRCSHYPPSPAFLDACDELGIIVMNSLPGWQYFGNEQFQANSIQNLRDMIHRDRNHACIFLWEAALNETQMSHSFMKKAQKTVHDELPYKDVYTCGWIDDVYDIFIPARQHAKAPDYWKNCNKNKPLIIAEYGDWEYYAQNAGFNQTEFKDLKETDRTSRQFRENGQERLAQQSLNFQDAHNDNLKGNIVGDANWLMFDYNRGYSSEIESSGIMDITRLPKQSFYFYQSQIDPYSTADTTFSRPMVYIANNWSDSSYKNVTVYSNCDEVELFLNNISLGKQKPTINQYSDALNHAPFIFEIKNYKPGEIKAIGYINKQSVAFNKRISAQKPNGLKISVDESGKKIQAGCNDVVFIYASIIDKNGTIIPNDTNIVKFSVEGDCKIIGENQIKAKAGIAAVLLKVGTQKEKIKITAASLGLKSDLAKINIK